MNTNTQKVMYNGIEYNAVVSSKEEKEIMYKKMKDDMSTRMIKIKIDRLIEALEELPSDVKIEVPAHLIDLLEKLSKGEELPESDDEKHRREYPDHRICEDCECCIGCGCCECLDDEDFKCDRCKAVKHQDHYITLNNDHSGNTICDECIPAYVKENGLEESDDEESEDGDWDGDLEDTPNCHECGEDCGRTIVSHQKYKNTYFCSQKCQRKYDGEQDDFTNRMCENPECKKEFDLADPHYYDEDQGVCYCCEECSAV